MKLDERDCVRRVCPNEGTGESRWKNKMRKEKGNNLQELPNAFVVVRWE